MNNEHSEEISFFRSTLQDYIAPLMDSLREEYLRLEALPPQCQEAFLIKIFGKDFYNSSRPWLSPKMLGWGILEILSKIGEYKTTGKIPEKGLASVILDEEQVAEREQELKKYTSIFSAFVEYSGKVFIFDSTFHYAERKKFYDLATLEAKDIGILSPKEIIAFLSDLASTDKKLCNTFLRSWSKHFEITFFSEAFKAKDMQSATEFLTGTHGGASPFAIEVTSVAKGLYMLRTFTQTIKQCLKASKKIDSKYYIKFSDAANQKDLAFLKDLENTYYSNSTLVELNNSLNAKEHLFTKNEYNAIIGSEIHPVIEQSEEQTSLEEIYETPLNNLDACFPGIKQKFKTDEVIDVITDYVAGHYIDDDPDVKKLFKYRITGLGELTPEMSEQKIVWYIKGKHPNDLNGFLFEISSDRRSYQEYVAKFFEFASGKDKDGRPIIMSIPIEPLTQHKNTKIVDALKEYPQLRDLF